MKSSASLCCPVGRFSDIFPYFRRLARKFPLKAGRGLLAGLIFAGAVLASAPALAQTTPYTGGNFTPGTRYVIEGTSGVTTLDVSGAVSLTGPGEGLRVMVNGQTGAVVAAVRQSGVESFFGLPGAGDGRVDGERSMRSAPVPVAYEKPSHLYRVLSPEEAFGRKVGRMGGTAAAERGKPAKKKSLLSKLFG